jgi:hypothetical protein
MSRLVEDYEGLFTAYDVVSMPRDHWERLRWEMRRKPGRMVEAVQQLLENALEAASAENYVLVYRSHLGELRKALMAFRRASDPLAPFDADSAGSTADQPDRTALESAIPIAARCP